MGPKTPEKDTGKMQQTGEYKKTEQKPEETEEKRKTIDDREDDRGNDRENGVGSDRKKKTRDIKKADKEKSQDGNRRYFKIELYAT